MQLLLDTHVFLWWLNDDKKLSSKASHLITHSETIYISSISIWEAAIKIQLGKLKVELDTLVDAMESEGFIELPFRANHAQRLLSLPNHHKDPFDRALIAQAVYEPLRLLTADKQLAEYSELVELI